MESHIHGPAGEYIPSEPAPAVEAEVVEAAAAADVERAKVEAKRDVDIAKIGVEREKVWQETRVAELEGRVRGMQEILDKMSPQDDPAPVQEPPAPPVVIEEAPVVEPPAEPVPPAVEEKPAPKKKGGFSWF